MWHIVITNFLYCKMYNSAIWKYGNKCYRLNETILWKCINHGSHTQMMFNKSQIPPFLINNENIMILKSVHGGWTLNLILAIWNFYGGTMRPLISMHYVRSLKIICQISCYTPMKRWSLIFPKPLTVAQACDYLKG